ncbi:A/G-specific adenine glycosylase [Blattabacterium cuenoti]|uniref:A/G-specific adenine glycosylase n=1 Tax=Blattabacterium cuenoti TaxID=1653831 RepID=UPI00163BFCE3|nr:A/G-specific adenine glycosylase [Blattabacterium cuenoti]
MYFSEKIINWYKKNGRKLPWRETKNPYYILVSEFMLQQTKVSLKTIKCYLNFIKKFPNLKKLAQAEEKDVLKEWEGLGYYTRAIHLHFFAKKLKNKPIDFFPKKYKDLIQYKGIGPYTGAAIASICFNEVIPAIDGNAYRVFSRYIGIYHDITLSVSNNKFRIYISKMIDHNFPGLFNQAIMDLGSILCTPKKAKCFLCPVKRSCFSFKNGTVYKFPVKNNRKKKPILGRFFYYIFICNYHKKLCLNKRLSKDIWKGLYDFPLIESKKKLTENEIRENVWKKFQLIYNNVIYQIRHKLTHQILSIQFLNCEITQNFSKNIFLEKFIFIPYGKICEYPFPSPILLFLKHEKMI